MGLYTTLNTPISEVLALAVENRSPITLYASAMIGYLYVTQLSFTNFVAQELQKLVYGVFNRVTMVVSLGVGVHGTDGYLLREIIEVSKT